MSDQKNSLKLDDKATAIQTLASLPNVTESEVGGVLLVSQLSEERFEMTQLRPTESVKPELISIGNTALKFYRDCEVIDYGPATTCIGKQVMWKPLSEVPLLESVASESADLANISLFDPKKAKLSKTRMTALRFDSSTTSVVFVQAMASSQIIASSKKHGVIVKKGVLDIPKGEIILLNQGVTAIVAGQFIYFTNRSAFQRLFNLLQEIRDRAETTFREVTLNLAIDGFDQMLDAVITQSQMLGKMASIQSKIDRYPQYKEALTMPNLLKFVRSHPDYQVELSGDGDDAKLIFRPDPQHRFKILKLLDDDYLTSELTTLEYETNSKGAPVSEK